MPSNLAHLLLEGRRWFDEHLHIELGVDITSAQSLLLTTLPPDGARQTELARELGVTRQAVNELVKHLEQKGLVVRVADPTSNRAKLVKPTEAGRASIDHASAVFDELEYRLRSRIGNLPVDLLREVLETDWGE